MSIFKPETVVLLQVWQILFLISSWQKPEGFFVIFDLILDENGPSLEIPTDVFLYQKPETIFRHKPKLREQNILLIHLVSCFHYIYFSSACCSFAV